MFSKVSKLILFMYVWRCLAKVTNGKVVITRLLQEEARKCDSLKQLLRRWRMRTKLSFSLTGRVSLIYFHSQILLCKWDIQAKLIQHGRVLLSSMLFCQPHVFIHSAMTFDCRQNTWTETPQKKWRQPGSFWGACAVVLMHATWSCCFTAVYSIIFKLYNLQSNVIVTVYKL